MRPTVSKTVLVLGVVSFLNELSSQIVAPLIPLLLVTTLGAGPVAMGLVDGVADAVASGFRLWAGRRSDVRGRRRKTFVVMGYGLSSIARPLVGLALARYAGVPYVGLYLLSGAIGTLVALWISRQSDGLPND